MGEEAMQEEVKSEEKKLEETEEQKKKEEKTDEKKEDPKPPSPFILSVDLHCVGCAKKIERSLLKIRGVEGVVMDMAQNQVTIKGVVEPKSVCTNIMKRTKRKAKVLSPLPAAEGEPMPEIVTSQVVGLATVELNVNMHCEACALQLKRKILKMKGVRTAETDLSSGKVRVTGTMDANKLVDYVYRRTKKQAKIVPQPEPEKPPPPPPEEAKPEEKKEEEKPAAEEPKPEEKKEDAAAGEKNDGDQKPPEKEEKKEGGEAQNNEDKGGEGGGKDAANNKGSGGDDNNVNDPQMAAQRMMYYYQPLYVIERIPPPQLFSDENPNACCIS